MEGRYRVKIISRLDIFKKSTIFEAWNIRGLLNDQLNQINPPNKKGRRESMNLRKAISIFVLVAFIQSITSCVSTRQRAPSELNPKKVYKIVRILKTSGEIIELDKDSPGYLSDSKVFFNTPFIIPVRGTTVSTEKNIFVLKTADGRIHEAVRFIKKGDTYKLFLSPTQSIPLSEVSMVWTRKTNVLRSVLLVAGVTVGASVILSLIYFATKKESCPFLYASDGMEFQLEGELYSGAIFKGIERRDFLKLHSATAQEGAYLFKIANEADETQYTDELTLVVVDHPIEVSAYIGSDGLVHTIRSPLTPILASDFDGQDFTASVSAVDGKMWCSNPVDKDPENPDHWWSGLVLNFPRPPSAKEAKLVVRIGNTYWADYSFGQFTGLLGNAMQSWQREREADPAIRQKADKFMSDQGIGLKVQVLRNEGWQDVGFFYPTGPFGIEDDIMVLPLEGIAGDSLTIRLQGGTFFWMIDYAAVDYSADCEVNIALISPQEASDHNGRDIKPLLLQADGDYFVMPEIGNYATIKYPAPPLPPGLERSLFMRSTGYYVIHPRQDVKPDLAKFLAISQRPELFLKFSLEELQKRITAARGAKGQDLPK